MANKAAFSRKLKTFTFMMQGSVSATYQEFSQNPMYPDDPSKLIPVGSAKTSVFKMRLIRSRSSEENYTEDSAGFMPDTFKWILTLLPMPEGSTFTYNGLFYTSGKIEPLVFQNKVYGYRSPVDVRSS